MEGWEGGWPGVVGSWGAWKVHGRCMEGAWKVERADGPCNGGIAWRRCADGRKRNERSIMEGKEMEGKEMSEIWAGNSLLRVETSKNDGLKRRENGDCSFPLPPPSHPPHLIHQSVVEEQLAVWLWPTPRLERLAWHVRAVR
eukprot:168783-Chlamydomonas_euryale.AAC.1